MATIVAARLQQARRSRGLSQGALAKAAHVTRQAVGAIESGRMQPGVAIALALARALEMTVEELFAEDEAQALPARRVASATIAGERVSHPLEGDHLAIEPAESPLQTVFVAGCDVAVGLLSRHASLRARDARVLWLAMTNRGAVDALVRGRVHAAVVHGDLPRAAAELERFELATTEEGWLLARGNPMRFRGAADLAKTSLRFANRPAGAGARRLLDEQLRRAGVDPRAVSGYERALAGQLDAGRAIAQGFADAAVGMASIAQLYSLDFIPLREERCTLLISRFAAASEIRPIVEALRSQAYRRDLQALKSYNVSRTGEAIA
jgi:putative molybdopterin biosynthesis protein